MEGEDHHVYDCRRSSIDGTWYLVPGPENVLWNEQNQRRRQKNDVPDADDDDDDGVIAYCTPTTPELQMMNEWLPSYNITGSLSHSAHVHYSPAAAEWMECFSGCV